MLNYQRVGLWQPGFPTFEAPSDPSAPAADEKSRHAGLRRKPKAKHGAHESTRPLTQMDQLMASICPNLGPKSTIDSWKIYVLPMFGKGNPNGFMRHHHVWNLSLAEWQIPNGTRPEDRRDSSCRPPRIHWQPHIGNAQICVFSVACAWYVPTSPVRLASKALSAGVSSFSAWPWTWGFRAIMKNHIYLQYITDYNRL